jgi:hypothetical protein
LDNWELTTDVTEGELEHSLSRADYALLESAMIPHNFLMAQSELGSNRWRKPLPAEVPAPQTKPKLLSVYLHQ